MSFDGFLLFDSVPDPTRIVRSYYFLNSIFNDCDKNTLIILTKVDKLEID